MLNKLNNINIPNVNIKDFLVIASTVLALDFIAFKLYITAHFSKLIKRVQNSEMTINYFGAAMLFYNHHHYYFLTKLMFFYFF